MHPEALGRSKRGLPSEKLKTSWRAVGRAPLCENTCCSWRGYVMVEGYQIGVRRCGGQDLKPVGNAKSSEAVWAVRDGKRVKQLCGDSKKPLGHQ